MFQRTLAFLFSVMLISTAARAEQKTLADVESADEAFQGLLEQLIDDPDDDPDDGSGRQLKRQPPPVTCPTGFTYVPVARSCYKVVYESHNWWMASTRCQQLVHGAHLVTITSKVENDALKTFLADKILLNHPACITGRKDNPDGFWTSGQRINAKRCRNSPFVWKPSSVEQFSFHYSYWLPGEPNCRRRKEHCMHIWTSTGFLWNDESCNTKMCPLCEYNPR